MEEIHYQVGTQVNDSMDDLIIETRSTIADELKVKGKELDNNIEELN
jgi:hypothetical protein